MKRAQSPRSPSKSGSDSSSTGKTETHVERQKQQSVTQAEATARISPVNPFICMRDMDTDSSTAEKIPSSGDMFWKSTLHFIYRTYQ